MRKLVWVTIGFSMACLAGACLYGGWMLLGTAVMLFFTGLLIILCRKIEWLHRPSLVLLGFSIGLCWFGMYDNLFVTLPRAADGKIADVTIEATDYSQATDYGSTVEGFVKFTGREYRVKAFLEEGLQAAPGDTVSGLFRFRLTTDGGMKDPTNHRTEGIFLLAYPVLETSVQKAERVHWRHYPAIWRRQVLNRIGELLTGDTGAFAAALLLGDRTNISYELNTAFKVSGISHVIAVSGLHVSILFGLVYVLMAKRRLLSFLLGIPILFLFSAVVGFTPSITRACIMQSLMLLALLINREYDPPTSLGFAVLVMLVWNPLTVLSVSFQLSVGCMMGIFLFSERIRVWLQRLFAIEKQTHPLLKRLKNFTVTSVSVTIGAASITTPLVAYYFGCISLVGVLTNLLTLWVIGIVFCGLILCLVVSLFHMSMASAIGWVVSIPIQFVLKTATALSRLPMAAVYTADLYVIAWLVGAYLLLGIFLLLRNRKPAVLIGCLVLTLLLSQLAAWLEPLRDNLRVTVLDVGQGQSILLQGEGKTFLVDCGGDDGKHAADIAAETLLSQGITRLDGIIVTHYDEDHVGGIGNLLTRVETDRLILPHVRDDAGVAESLIAKTEGTVQYVLEDLHYTFGSIKMTIFAPFSYENGNESSLCILFQRENCDILITGDRGELGEMMLLNGHALPKLELLVAGHHGSKYSTNEKLLAATAPETVVISVGADNRFGHPSDEVLERLEHMGCAVYRTDLDGTIIFRR